MASGTNIEEITLSADGFEAGQRRMTTRGIF
jgi:hypothetical protein